MGLFKIITLSRYGIMTFIIPGYDFYHAGPYAPPPNFVKVLNPYTMKRILSAILLLVPVTMFAHEGHGHYPATQVWHYLTSPGHIVQTSIVVAAFVAILVFQGVKRLKASKR